MTKAQKEAFLAHVVRNAVEGAESGGEFDHLFEADEGLDEDARSEALVAFRRELAGLASGLRLP